MRVFVTGATGFIGSAVVKELISGGHQVLGLARSQGSAARLREMGAEVQEGSLEDVESLQQGASQADGVIHLAFIHDFSKYEAAAVTDKQAIDALGAALAGSNRPLIITSGTNGIQPAGELITEDDDSIGFPRASEVTALAQAERGVRVSVIRLPPSVHGKGDGAFVPTLIDIARKKGVSAYAGEGNNRWPAVHVLDAAVLFRLALEKGVAGARYNGVADEGIRIRELAEVIAHRLDMSTQSKSPDELAEHFGWMSRFIVLDAPASSTKTRTQLGWAPLHPGLLEDLESGHYFHRAN